MRDRINRNMAAEENQTLSGHPASERIDIWTSDITTNADQPLEGRTCKAPETPDSRRRKLEEMEDVIQEDIARTSGSLDKEDLENLDPDWRIPNERNK